jgi:hypothetical protein
MYRELNDACPGLTEEGEVIFQCPVGGEVTSDFLKAFTDFYELQS